MADITVDQWQDFDFATLDVTNLGTNDHATGGTWTISDSGSRLSTSSSGEQLLAGTLNGSLNDASGTHGLAMTAPSPGATSIVIYEWAADQGLVSWGFWYKFPAAFIGSDDEHDILYVENAFGANELYVKQTDHSGRAGNLFLYTGESGYSTAIPIAAYADQWIWITAKLETGGSHRLRAYDSSGAQIGSEQTRTAHATEDSYQYSLGSAIGALQGHTGTIYFDDLIVDWADGTFPLGPPSGGTHTQEGFRWRNDDGDEDAATWKAAQDSNASQPLNANVRLRVLVDADGENDATAYTLRYKKSTDGSYVAVTTAASSDVAPVVESGDCTNSGNNTASGSWDVSTPAAATGDLIIVCLGWDDSLTTTSVSAPTGPNGETANSIVGPVASDSTEVRSQAWYYVATGAWSAGTLTFTPSANEQWTATVVKVLAGEFDAGTPIGASGSFNTDTGTSVTSPTFSAGSSDGGGTLMVWLVVDADPIDATPSGWTDVASVDRGAISGTCSVRTAAVSDSESIASATWTIGGDSSANLGWVVRGVTVTNPIYVSPSANITGGGEATTAQLAAPSGKTTGDFDAGRMWDDENGTDTIDITEDGYTEVEWCLIAQSPAAVADVYQFRVYAGAGALNAYDVTPELTIASAGPRFILGSH